MFFFLLILLMLNCRSTEYRSPEDSLKSYFADRSRDLGDIFYFGVEDKVHGASIFFAYFPIGHGYNMEGKGIGLMGGAFDFYEIGDRTNPISIYMADPDGKEEKDEIYFGQQTFGYSAAALFRSENPIINKRNKNNAMFVSHTVCYKCKWKAVYQDKELKKQPIGWRTKGIYYTAGQAALLLGLDYL
ncbi:MAG TPA: hypothetical protein PL163_24180 [Leptospiraceae bacterium]|nr:hypothetical protein [Leptospiraceae bacterium]HNM02735.1 hypothetical protein [Leptospiraceae bacterium]